MLIDNRKIVKEANSSLFEELLAIEDKMNDYIIIEPAKRAGETLAIKNNDSLIYIHSKYNSLNEAKTFVEQFSNFKKTEHFLFIGVGLGYHLIELLEQFPKASYCIFEPNIHILSAFLQKQNLAKLKARLVGIFTTTNRIEKFYEQNKKYLSTMEVIHWPIINKIYAQEIIPFEQNLKELVKKEKSSKDIVYAHQGRWQINGMINFPKILKSSHFFDLDLSALKNKPAIIVAAGPSLAIDMHLMKEIKEKGKAYIFAVGSAINALIENDILPDLFISIDPQITNQNVVKKVKEKNISIPMLFGSTVGYETLENYPGPLIHFFISKENISKYLLDISGEHILVDKPSVSITAIEMCSILKMGPILLAGQNCAYLNNQRYSDGVGYTHQSSELSEKELTNLLEVESVDGDTIYSDDIYLFVKEGLEYYLKTTGIDNVYNTTKHGANIVGAQYKPLEEFLANELLENNVTSEITLVENSYNLKEVKERYSTLENSFSDLLIYVKEIDKIMAEVIEKKNSKVYKNVNQLLLQYDTQYDAIHTNLFFKVVIDSLIRVQQEVFLSNAYKVKESKREKDKVEKFVEIHVPYIRSIFAQIIYVQNAFKELNKIKDF